MVSDQELQRAIQANMGPRRGEAGRRVGDNARRREADDMDRM
jgi:hypothetical protein